MSDLKTQVCDFRVDRQHMTVCTPSLGRCEHAVIFDESGQRMAHDPANLVLKLRSKVTGGMGPLFRALVSSSESSLAVAGGILACSLALFTSGC